MLPFEREMSIRVGSNVSNGEGGLQFCGFNRCNKKDCDHEIHRYKLVKGDPWEKFGYA